AAQRVGAGCAPATETAPEPPEAQIPKLVDGRIQKVGTEIEIITPEAGEFVVGGRRDCGRIRRPRDAARRSREEDDRRRAARGAGAGQEVRRDRLAEAHPARKPGGEALPARSAIFGRSPSPRDGT